MSRIYLAYYFLISGLSINAQPTINEWYDFGRTQSALNSVHVTDTCYYSIGMVACDVMPGKWDLVFTKMDLTGNVLEQKFLHNDTANLNCFYSNLIPTYDDNFVTFVDFDEYFLFVKYSPSGDTLFTSVIKDIYLNDGNVSIYPTNVMEILSDSSYTGLVSIQNELSLEVFMALVNISKSGQMNFYETYNIDQIGYTYTYPRGLVKLNDGYMISSDIIKATGPYVDYAQHTRLIKIDNNGVEQFRWTDWANESTVLPFGLTKTPDGGYLYGGITGWFNTVYNSQLYRGHIVKLDDNLDQEWEIEYGDTTGLGYINFSQILDLDNGEYIATGHCTKDTMSVGWMINFNLDGEVIWDSYFSYVGQTSPNEPEHEFYDVKQTADAGFIMVGKAWDVQTTFEGNPGSFGWLVKTDSVGCLVPGCQDFLEVENDLEPTIKLITFPNPTNNILYIYYNDSHFIGTEIIWIYDINGNAIKSWKLHSNDMTYIYECSGLASGTYIIKVVSEGVEKSTSKFIKVN